MIPILSLLHVLATGGGDADPQISGNWVITLIGAIFSGLALLLGKKMGKAEAQGMRLEDPVPEIPTRTRKISQPPSWDQHEALIRRVTVIESELKQLRDENSREYKQLLEAGAAREHRIMDKMDAIARDWHERMDKLITLKGGRL